MQTLGAYAKLFALQLHSGLEIGAMCCPSKLCIVSDLTQQITHFACRSLLIAVSRMHSCRMYGTLSLLNRIDLPKLYYNLFTEALGPCTKPVYWNAE